MPAGRGKGGSSVKLTAVRGMVDQNLAEGIAHRRVGRVLVHMDHELESLCAGHFADDAGHGRREAPPCRLGS